MVPITDYKMEVSVRPCVRHTPIRETLQKKDIGTRLNTLTSIIVYLKNGIELQSGS